MGDGENGLALAIFAAMGAFVVGGFALFFLVGRVIARRLGLGRSGVLLAALGAGLVGVGAGVLLVVATFYESTWSPPPRITLIVPPGFAHRWVVLLQDPSASRELVWHGFEAPLHGISTQLAVPASGVVRVRSLAHVAGRGDTTIVWSDGASATGFSGGTAPAALHADSFVAFLRGDAANRVEDDLPGAADAFAAYIRHREQAR